MSGDELQKFIEQLEMLISLGSKDIKAVGTRGPAGDFFVYVIDDSKSFDVTVIIPPNIDYCIGLGIWNQWNTMVKYNNVKVIGGGDKLISIAELFKGLIAESIDCSELDIHNVTGAYALFERANIKELDLTWLKRAKIENIERMFMNYSGKEIDLSQLDTSRVTTMREMFKGCEADLLGEMDTSQVTDMQGMFSRYEYDGTLDLSWLDVSKVTSAYEMFMHSKVKNINLSNLEFNALKEARYMFYKCNANLIGVGDLAFPELEDTSNMFYGYKAAKLEFKDAFSKVNNCSSMFAFAYIDELNIKNMRIIHDSKLKYSEMFAGFHGEVTLDKVHMSGTSSSKVLKLQILVSSMMAKATCKLG